MNHCANRGGLLLFCLILFIIKQNTWSQFHNLSICNVDFIELINIIKHVLHKFDHVLKTRISSMFFIMNQ